MTLRIYNSPIQDACDAIVDAIDAGSGAGRIEIRSGARPAINAAVTGTLLATFTLSDPAFGAASANGTRARAAASGLSIDDVSADATGTAGYGVALDSDDNVIFTGTVGTSGEDFNLSTLSIVSGQVVRLNTFNFDLPQA